MVLENNVLMKYNCWYRNNVQSRYCTTPIKSLFISLTFLLIIILISLWFEQSRLFDLCDYIIECILVYSELGFGPEATCGSNMSHFFYIYCLCVYAQRNLFSRNIIVLRINSPHHTSKHCDAIDPCFVQLLRRMRKRRAKLPYHLILINDSQFEILLNTN